MVYANSFEMFKTLLSTIKESNLPYKVIGNYGDYPPNIQAFGSHHENTQMKFNFLVISPMLTFAYKGSILYSDERLNDIRRYFEQLDIIESNIKFDTNITLG